MPEFCWCRHLKCTDLLLFYENSDCWVFELFATFPCTCGHVMWNLDPSFQTRHLQQRQTISPLRPWTSANHQTINPREPAEPVQTIFSLIPTNHQYLSSERTLTHRAPVFCPSPPRGREDSGWGGQNIQATDPLKPAEVKLNVHILCFCLSGRWEEETIPATKEALAEFLSDEEDYLAIFSSHPQGHREIVVVE